MTSPHTQFDGAIPEHYDHGLGPYIFAAYGNELAGRVAADAPTRVLELAAGTGILSAALRSAIGSTAALTVTDLNPPMLEIARRRLDGAPHTTIADADASALPWPDGSFDAIACQFGVMFFPDVDASYREARRVLAEGGHYHLNTWCDLDQNPFARLAQEAMTPFFPDDPPGFFQVPFGYHDRAAIEDSMRRAGFALVRTEVVAIEQEIDDLDRFATGLVYGNPIIEEIRERGIAPERVHEAVRATLIRSFGAESARMPLRAIFVDAVRAS